jgi:ATP-dependent DNA ligase
MVRLVSLPERQAAFIEPMECLAVSKLPEGPEWIYQIKLDGCRAVAINSKGVLSLVSRNRKSFNTQYPYIVEALSELPENTVVDGEIVALGDTGRSHFSLLQHSRSHASRICYFIFDLLVYQNRDLMRIPYIQRREIMDSALKFRSPRMRIAHHFETSASCSRTRTGGCRREAEGQRLRVRAAHRSLGQISPESRTGIGYRGTCSRAARPRFGNCWLLPEKELIYVAHVRNGFVPTTRRQVFARLRPLVTPNCPFANLPEMHKGRWGEGLTAEDMKKCVWVRPELVAQIEFLEWTESGHLRHSKFAGLREDKAPQAVVKEQAGKG